MKLTKKDVLTVPNIISVFRLALIPFIVWAYCQKKNYLTILFVFVSGVSDVIDGIIARKCNLVSDVGKFIDPLADWLTQFALIACVAITYPYIWIVVGLFVIRQLIMFAMGVYAFKRIGKVNSAKWYGKANTVALYLVAGLIILFPTMHLALVYALIGVCGGLILFSLVMYARFYKNVCNQATENE